MLCEKGSERLPFLAESLGKEFGILHSHYQHDRQNPIRSENRKKTMGPTFSVFVFLRGEVTYCLSGIQNVVGRCAPSSYK